MPSELFSIANSTLPSWRLCQTRATIGFDQLNSAFGIVAIVGYEKLVSSYAHYVGILERDGEHLEDFYIMKAALDLEVGLSRPPSK
jgi:hypothetical protein